jgi:hypothetical protein
MRATSGPISTRNASALGPPEDAGARVEDGQIVSQHWRAVEARSTRGRGIWWCRSTTRNTTSPTRSAMTAWSRGATTAGCAIFGPDLAAAEERLQAALDELLAGGASDLEAKFPAVGRDFAEEMRVECGRRRVSRPSCTLARVVAPQPQSHGNHDAPADPPVRLHAAQPPDRPGGTDLRLDPRATRVRSTHPLSVPTRRGPAPTCGSTARS